MFPQVRVAPQARQAGGELRRGEDVVRLTERERDILRMRGATPVVKLSL